MTSLLGLETKASLLLALNNEIRKINERPASDWSAVSPLLLHLSSFVAIRGQSDEPIDALEALVTVKETLGTISCSWFKRSVIVGCHVGGTTCDGPLVVRCLGRGAIHRDASGRHAPDAWHIIAQRERKTTPSLLFVWH